MFDSARVVFYYYCSNKTEIKWKTELEYVIQNSNVLYICLIRILGLHYFLSKLLFCKLISVLTNIPVNISVYYVFTGYFIIYVINYGKTRLLSVLYYILICWCYVLLIRLCKRTNILCSIRTLNVYLCFNKYAELSRNLLVENVLVCETIRCTTNDENV